MYLFKIDMEDIRKKLSDMFHLDDAKLLAVLERLDELGVVNMNTMKFVTSDDLKGVLKPVQARMLLHECTPGLLCKRFANPFIFVQNIL